MARPNPITFGDIAYQPLVIYAGLAGVPFAGLDEAALRAALGNANAGQGDNAPVNSAVVTADRLRHWCTALGLPSGGTKPVLVDRLYDHSNPAPPPPPPAPVLAQPPPPDNEAPLSNPKEIAVIELTSTMNVDSFKRWQADVKSAAETRGFEEVLRQLQEAENAAARNAVVVTPRQEQFMKLLKQGVNKSLGKEVATRVRAAVDSGEIQDECYDILNWIKRQVQAVSPATKKVAEKTLDKAQWKASKSSLQTWVAQLRLIASRIGEALPQGFATENRIRELVFKNVSAKQPRVAHVINQYKGHEVNEEDYTVDKLVTVLTKLMAEDECEGEAQCQSYAVAIQGDQDYKAMLAAKDRQITQLKKSAESSAMEVDESPVAEEDAFHGAYPNPNYRAPSSSSSSNNSEKKFCVSCHRHYKGLGKREEKDYVIRNHNTADCKHKTGGGGGDGKGSGKKGGKKGEGKKAVKKDNGKKAGKKGEGKNKKGDN